MKPRLIAVTGKTGVGKTYLLKKYNYTQTIYADDYVKEVLYLKGSPVFKKVVAAFGASIVEKAKVNSRKLGKIVLSDLEKLEQLAKIVNPEIKRYLKSLTGGTHIVEIATYLKYERYFQKLFNQVILITNKNANAQDKFTYLGQKIVILKSRNIKYTHRLERDQPGFEKDFFRLLDKLTSLENS